MIQKLREFGQLFQEFGWTFGGFLFAAMASLAFGSFLFGFSGMLMIIVIIAVATVLLSKGKDLFVRPAKFAGVALVALAAFLASWVVVTEIFTDVAKTTIGGVVSVVLALLVAFRYAGSARKNAYHTLALLACGGYLTLAGIGQWGLTPAQRAGGETRSRYVLRSLYDWWNSHKDTVAISVGRSADETRLAARMLDEVTVHTPGLTSDFKDDHGVTITAYRICEGDVLLRFPGEDVKTFDGEDYVKVKVDGDPPILGWFKFRTWHKNLAKKVVTPSSSTSAPSPVAATSTPIVRPATVVAPTLPLVPALAPSVLDEETVVANKDHWTISKVPVKLQEHVWIGPFPSEGDGKRLVVCIDGGQPVIIQPYLWPNGKYGARIHRMSGDQATQYLWVRVSDGAPLTIRLNKNRPY